MAGDARGRAGAAGGPRTLRRLQHQVAAAAKHAAALRLVAVRARRAQAAFELRHKLQLAQRAHARQPPPARQADAQVAAALVEAAEELALRAVQGGLRAPLPRPADTLAGGLCSQGGMQWAGDRAQAGIRCRAHPIAHAASCAKRQCRVPCAASDRTWSRGQTRMCRVRSCVHAQGRRGRERGPRARAPHRTARAGRRRVGRRAARRRPPRAPTRPPAWRARAPAAAPRRGRRVSGRPRRRPHPRPPPTPLCRYRRAPASRRPRRARRAPVAGGAARCAGCQCAAWRRSAGNNNQGPVSTAASFQAKQRGARPATHARCRVPAANQQSQRRWMRTGWRERGTRWPAAASAPPARPVPQLLQSDAPSELRRASSAAPRPAGSAGDTERSAGSADPGGRSSALRPRASGVSSPGADGARRSGGRAADADAELAAGLAAHGAGMLATRSKLASACSHGGGLAPHARLAGARAVRRRPCGGAGQVRRHAVCGAWLCALQ